MSRQIESWLAKVRQENKHELLSNGFLVSTVCALIISGMLRLDSGTVLVLVTIQAIGVAMGLHVRWFSGSWPYALATWLGFTMGSVLATGLTWIGSTVHWTAAFVALIAIILVARDIVHHQVADNGDIA